MILKKVYIHNDLDDNAISNYFKNRNDALKWEKENKENFNFPIFLMKKEITKKYYNKIFTEV